MLDSRAVEDSMVLKSEIPSAASNICASPATASRFKLSGPTLGALKHFSSHLRALLRVRRKHPYYGLDRMECMDTKNFRVCPCKACHRRCKEVHKDPIGGEKLCVFRMMPNYSAILTILILRVAIRSGYVFLSVSLLDFHISVKHLLTC